MLLMLSTDALSLIDWGQGLLWRSLGSQSHGIIEASILINSNDIDSVFRITICDV